MITVISPAKKLLTKLPPLHFSCTTPELLAKTQVLITSLKTYSKDELARIMPVSDALLNLNLHRFKTFDESLHPKTTELYPALFYFQGDVYQSLDAKTFSQEDIQFTNNHLGILSGLYGYLRPLDLMQPYRLEMGTQLPNPAGKNLYAFWQNVVTNTINQILKTHKHPYLINLASEEYSHVIKTEQLAFPKITLHFKEEKNGKLVTIGINAKRARGAMAREIILNRIDNPEELTKVSARDYRYEQSLSDELDWVYVKS